MADELMRKSLATVPDTLISAMRPVRELTDLTAMRGTPCVVVSDNETEITLNPVPAWCETPNRLALLGLGKATPGHTFEIFAGGYVTNCLMRRCSPTSIMPAGISPRVGGIITRDWTGYTPRLATALQSVCRSPQEARDRFTFLNG